VATQFRSAVTGEWVVTRWFAGVERGTQVDFGARQARAFEVFDAARDAGEQVFVVGDDGSVVTGDEFEDMVNAAGMTFGEFGGSFEVGAGDMATFAGF